MFEVLLGTALSGVGSVLIAAWLTQALLARWSRALLSLAAGALLATALMHLLPEAFESGMDAHGLFATLLGGLVFFFLLDKAELWHHGHEHHQGLGHNDQDHGHDHAHAHDHTHDHAHGHAHGYAGSWSVLFGDSIHALGDGILVAAAFLIHPSLGWAACVAVLAHEVPHHIGDLVVLRQNGQALSSALGRLCLAGSATMVGGVVGYAFIQGHEDWLPYWVVLASSSYIYVSLADLIPQLQQRLSARETLVQVVALALGIALVSLTASLTHGMH